MPRAPWNNMASSTEMLSAAGTPAVTGQPPKQPLVTFMIATHNRVDELERTLHSCQQQTWPAKEIFVVDNASSDHSREMVLGNFPHVNFVRKDRNIGSVAARNDILRRSQGDYVIALDDDSRFLDDTACERIVQRMEAEPDLGILSFQVIGPEYPERMREENRWTGEWHCSTYAACGAAIRRKLFDETGLFPEFFFHMYEEPDLCLRSWNAGYRVLQWNEILVYHEWVRRNRNETRTHQMHARNEACSIWMRYPWHLVVPATCVRLWRQFRYGVSRGGLWSEPRIWWETACMLPRALRQRQSVNVRTVKIALALNQVKVADPQTVWQLGDVSWRSLLRKDLAQSRSDLRAQPR